MTYLLRFSGKETLGYSAANSSILEKVIQEVVDLSKSMDVNVFLDELSGSSLQEIYRYTLPKSLIPLEEQLEFSFRATPKQQAHSE